MTYATTKEPNGGSNVKPRLVKVRVANAAQRSAVLRKAMILKESVFMCAPATLLLNALIFVAFMTLYVKRKMKLVRNTTLIGVALFHSGQLRNDEYLTPTLLNKVRPVKVLTHRSGR